MIDSPRKIDEMKTSAALVMILAGLVAAIAFAQSSLFDRYDVNMNKWAQLPDNLPWGGVTTWSSKSGNSDQETTRDSDPIDCAWRKSC